MLTNSDHQAKIADPQANHIHAGPQIDKTHALRQTQIHPGPPADPALPASETTRLEHTAPAVHDIHSTANDAGNKSSLHYQKRLSPLRFYLRQRCLPLVRKETEVLHRLQVRARHPVLDVFFAWSANLASHTFYVLMLPLPIWFGASDLSRDLVVVLGAGIYISGFCKDLLCLPRPRSPPLHRITMLSYTAHEYGWPSSHLANATAVTLVLAAKLWLVHHSWPVWQWVAAMAALALYCLSLLGGRLYCGMHGFFDIGTGLAIGAAVFAGRHWLGAPYDQWLLHQPPSAASIAATILFMLVSHLGLIHVYPEPVDDCPCFDDSVAFVGVLLGLDLAHYACVVSNHFAASPHFDPLLVPYDASRGVVHGAMRMALGVALVVAWKAVSKPVIFSVLPPLYKFIGVYFPRSHYISTAHTSQSSRQIRSQSISNMNMNELVEKVVAAGESVGPADDIDAYELLDYQSKHPGQAVPVVISGVFRARYDVEIIGRVIVYAGVAVVAVWGFGLAAEALGL